MGFDRERAAARIEAMAEEIVSIGVPHGLALDGEYGGAEFMVEEERRIRSALKAYARRVREGNFKPAPSYR